MKKNDDILECETINKGFRFKKDNVKFNSMWSTNSDIIAGDDLSRVTEDTYTEIPAFSRDSVTGEFINDSSIPVLVYKGKVNIKEQIDSYYGDTDIYTIINKYRNTGDQNVFNIRNDGVYGDFSYLPDNINEYTNFMAKNFEVLKSMDPELANLVMKDNVTQEEISLKVNEVLSRKQAAAVKSETNESEVQK